MQRSSTLQVLLFPIIVLLCSPAFIQAQDIHFSQFANTPLNLNPAMTGLFNGSHRFNGVFRKQWYTVPVDYQTFSGAYDTRLKSKRKSPHFVGLGGLINYDRSGDSKLSLLQVMANVSYSMRISKSNRLSIGLQGGVSNRTFSAGGLTFGQQFVGGQFDPNSGNGESLLDQSSKFFPLVNAGINWRWQNNPRAKVDVGFSLANINQPDVSFFGQTGIKLNNRVAYHLVGNVKVAGPFDLVVQGLGQQQGEYSEFIPGIGVRFHLDEKKFRELSLQLVGFYRFEEKADSWVPALNVFYRTWQFGMGWDINTSLFEQATRKNGGPEFSVIYIIQKPQPLDQYKNCPIY